MVLSEQRKRNHVNTTLRAIREQGPCTRQEAGIETSVEALRLESEGLLRRVSVRRTGQRGRPAVVWGLTDKAHKRVKRAMSR